MATPTSLPAAQTTGNVLTAAYMNDLRGAFRVLTLDAVTTSTQVTSTSSTYADAGALTLTITPQATTNKILIIAATSLFASGNPVDIGIRLLRGATNIFTSLQGIFTAASQGGSYTSMFLDSPATTSATTYKVQFNRNSGAGTATINVAGVASSTLLIAEISA